MTVRMPLKGDSLQFCVYTYSSLTSSFPLVGGSRSQKTHSDWVSVTVCWFVCNSRLVLVLNYHFAAPTANILIWSLGEKDCCDIIMNYCYLEKWKRNELDKDVIYLIHILLLTAIWSSKHHQPLQFTTSKEFIVLIKLYLKYTLFILYTAFWRQSNIIIIYYTVAAFFHQCN